MNIQKLTSRKERGMAVYPSKGKNLYYITPDINNEVGEVADKIKKLISEIRMTFRIKTFDGSGDNK